MDNKTLQQVRNVNVLMNIWMMDGPGIWDFSGNEPNIYVDDVNNNVINTSQEAIDYKRRGKYAEALSLYMHVIGACKKKTGKIPVVYIRGLFKVLICANCFETAFVIASTVAADMEQSNNVNPQETQLFTSYFEALATLSLQVIDERNFSNVKDFAANFSGNPYYSLFLSSSEIEREFAGIRGKVKKIYGV